MTVQSAFPEQLLHPVLEPVHPISEGGGHAGLGVLLRTHFFPVRPLLLGCSVVAYRKMALQDFGYGLLVHVVCRRAGRMVRIIERDMKESGFNLFLYSV